MRDRSIDTSFAGYSKLTLVTDHLSRQGKHSSLPNALAAPRESRYEYGAALLGTFFVVLTQLET